jgi:hypothetical protein
MKIKFIEDFTSPKYGNVWYGRVMALKDEDAQSMINNGYAEELKEEDNGNSDVDGNKEPSKDRPKRRGRAS